MFKISMLLQALMNDAFLIKQYIPLAQLIIVFDL